MNETQIRYLKEDEKQNCRFLYELCFPEDTQRFVDYYYKEKCRDNRIAVLEADGQIATMVHANPFMVSMYGRKVCVNYIVAVATDPAFRRQGLMRNLLGRVLRDCHNRGEPFSFLMPANAAYYQSIGYRYWNSQLEWKLCGQEERKWSAWTAGTDAVQADPAEMAEFADQILGKKFDLYIFRDEAYYKRLKEEQRSEDGDVAVIRGQNGEIQGMFCYSTEDGFEIREPIFCDNIQESIHPVMMGRIVHLQKFVELLKFQEPFSQIISITDDMIPENNGCFRIDIDAAGGRAERVKAPKNAETMDIAEAGPFFFDKMRIFINEMV